MLSFPPFRLDLVEERLFRGDLELRLRRKPFAILRYLAANPGRVVTHSEIIDAVWGPIAMSESLLRTHVRDLRRVLGDPLIETVVGRGYRFATNSPTVPAADASAARHLELVRSPGSRPTAQTRSRASLGAAHARVLAKVAEALDAVRADATIIVIVAEGAHCTSFRSNTENADEHQQTEWKGRGHHRW